MTGRECAERAGAQHSQRVHGDTGSPSPRSSVTATDAPARSGIAERRNSPPRVAEGVVSRTVRPRSGTRHGLGVELTHIASGEQNLARVLRKR